MTLATRTVYATKQSQTEKIHYNIPHLRFDIIIEIQVYQLDYVYAA